MKDVRRLRTRFGRPVAISLLVSGCAADPWSDQVNVSSQSQELYSASFDRYWSGREIPVCWDANTVSRTNFAIESARFQDAALGSWAQATGLVFTGWSTTCAAEPQTSIRLSVVDDGGGFEGRATVGHYGTGNWALVVAGTSPGVAAHELGHNLNFAHENDRPDFPSSAPCDAGGVLGEAFGTPPDWRSIMSLGYCNTFSWLTYWDRVGAQRAYGYPNYFADINADGRVDTILLSPRNIMTRSSSGTQFGLPTVKLASNFVGQKGTFFADVNGDQFSDVIAVDDTGLWVRTGSTSGFSSLAAKWTTSSFFGSRETLFSDVNGDGKADGIALSDGNVSVALAGAAGFSAAQQWLAQTFAGAVGNFAADVTGDGRADLIAATTDGVWVSASTGSAFSAPVRWSTENVTALITVAIADVSGDQKADLVSVKSDGVWVGSSTGSGFSSSSNWTSGRFVGERGTFFANLDGQLGADAIRVDNNAVSVRLSNGSSFATATQWANVTSHATRDAAPGCVDAVKNGSETDLDCGGSCGGCALGKLCSTPIDCADGDCVAGTCTAISTCHDGVGCGVAFCGDGVKNGAETDVDCGGGGSSAGYGSGTCPSCAAGFHCAVALDCLSRNCASGVCAAATCTDGIRNGGELGVDCGPSCGGVACPNGSSCYINAHCVSGKCQVGHCVP